LREDIDRLIASGNQPAALAALQVFWRENTRPAAANFVLSRFAKIQPAINAAACKVSILRSFTVEPLVPLLRAGAAVNGIDAAVHVGNFNAHVQDLLDPNSSHNRFAADVTILAVQSRDVAPDLWFDFTALTREQIAAAIARVAQEFREWVKICRSHSQSHLIVHTLEIPSRGSAGILDSQDREGQAAAFRAINASLAELAAQHRGVYLLDYDGLIAESGRTNWRDERKWLDARLPIAADCLPHLATEWLRFLHPLTGRICKAVAIDLDNTLWGGVIAEDGMAGIQLGAEYPGAAFRNLQRALLDLSRRGILLALCSKNNPADAMEALEKHPGMLLRPADFAAMRINWHDKATNLREIAAELNIGVDAIAFLDDNPAERSWVRQEAPEVTVLELPPDPMEYERVVRDAPVFERLTLAAEDRERGRYYSEQAQREDLKRKASSLEDFYRSLEMRAQIARVTPQTLARVAQLTQKTNQFNLTTRRYTEQQISEIAADPAARVYSLAAQDRFGDNGIVGVAIARLADDALEIDTFLLSCRVIGRTIETALLGALADHGRKLGAAKLAGEFIPTRKNAPAANFYANHGFRQTESRWEFDLAGGAIAATPWIDITFSDEA
jgi:FkbH-like protein